MLLLSYRLACWTGLLDWLAGLACWTGWIDWLGWPSRELDSLDWTLQGGGLFGCRVATATIGVRFRRRHQPTRPAHEPLPPTRHPCPAATLHSTLRPGQKNREAGSIWLAAAPTIVYRPRVTATEPVQPSSPIHGIHLRLTSPPVPPASVTPSISSVQLAAWMGWTMMFYLGIESIHL